MVPRLHAADAPQSVGSAVIYGEGADWTKTRWFISTYYYRKMWQKSFSSLVYVTHLVILSPAGNVSSFRSQINYFTFSQVHLKPRPHETSDQRSSKIIISSRHFLVHSSLLEVHLKKIPAMMRNLSCISDLCRNIHYIRTLHVLSVFLRGCWHKKSFM